MKIKHKMLQLKYQTLIENLEYAKKSAENLHAMIGFEEDFQKMLHTFTIEMEELNTYFMEEMGDKTVHTAVYKLAEIEERNERFER